MKEEHEEVSDLVKIDEPKLKLKKLCKRLLKQVSLDCFCHGLSDLSEFMS